MNKGEALLRITCLRTGRVWQLRGAEEGTGLPLDWRRLQTIQRPSEHHCLRLDSHILVAIKLNLYAWQNFKYVGWVSHQVCR